MKLRKKLSALIKYLPDNGRSIKRLYWQVVKAQRHRDIAKLQQSGSWHLPPEDLVLWVDPARIQMHTNFKRDGDATEPRNAVFGFEVPANSVLDGDWDKGGIPFSELRAYQAIKQRIETNTAWRDTAYFKESLGDIEAGRALWGCSSAEELDARFAYIDQLIDSIRAHGVLPSAQVSKIQDPSGRQSDEVEVNIGRNGELLFQDGRHRLAVAQLLGIQRIPVRVRVRHIEWQKLREFLFSMLEGGGGAAKDGMLYQSPAHPDLKDIPAEHSCDDRFEIMKRALKVQQGRVLDIGCNLGFFCHAFEAQGLDCVGVEYGPDIAYATDSIRISESKRFEVVAGDVLDPAVHDKILKKPVDVVNALSIFHHFLKTRENYERLEALLKKLHPQQMFFEPHRTDEPHMQGVYANLSVEEFLALIQKHTGLDHAELIYTAADGRRLYSLTR